MKKQIVYLMAVCFSIALIWQDSAMAKSTFDKGGHSAADKALLRMNQQQQQQKQENFGKNVSAQAKVFRIEPFPGHRNFGNWVSCQRSQKKNCANTVPPGTPTVVTPAPITPDQISPPVASNPTSPVNPPDSIVPVAPTSPTSPLIPTSEPAPTGTLAGSLGT